MKNKSKVPGKDIYYWFKSNIFCHRPLAKKRVEQEHMKSLKRVFSLFLLQNSE